MLMRYYMMPSRDIRVNLATEEYLLNQYDLAEPLLLLYIQAPCVIIGRNQNAYEEIHLPYLREHNITLTRRISGGGAVYDDLGNISFSFVSQKGKQAFGDYQSVTQPIVQALQKMGASAVEASGRNDLYIEGKKFSGNAMYTKNGRTYSHGTLMYDVDLSVLSQVLNVSKEKFQSKATPSTRKVVTNIKPYLASQYQELTTEQFGEALLCAIYQVDDLKAISSKQIVLSAEDQAAIQALVENKYANHDWIYGETPQFDLQRRTRIPQVGIIDIKLSMHKGKITKAQIFGDFFGQEPIEKLTEQLVGLAFEDETFASFLATCQVDCYIHNLTNQQFFSLLFD